MIDTFNNRWLHGEFYFKLSVQNHNHKPKLRYRFYITGHFIFEVMGKLNACAPNILSGVYPAASGTRHKFAKRCRHGIVVVLQLLLPDVCLASQMKFHVSNNVVNLSTADGRMSGITQKCEHDKCNWPLKK